MHVQLVLTRAGQKDPDSSIGGTLLCWFVKWVRGLRICAVGEMSGYSLLKRITFIASLMRNPELEVCTQWLKCK